MLSFYIFNETQRVYPLYQPAHLLKHPGIVT